jgi:hypothetical protein
LTNCRSPSSGPSSVVPMELPDGQLAFTSQPCDDDGNADIQLLTLPNLDVSPLLTDQRDDRAAAWSPNGQMLGVLSYGVNQRTLSVVDLSIPEERAEFGDFVVQFAWTQDGTSLYYLEQEEGLLKYDVLRNESTQVVDAVSHFSLSSNGQWLGLSIRDAELGGAFTFRVLNAHDGRLLSTPTNKGPYLGSGRSVWSPKADKVAVLFGATASQPSEIVVYVVHTDHLEMEANATARAIYQQDYGDDLPSVEFGDLTWSPDGQSLLVVRSTTDAQAGGEILQFGSGLQDHQRLPFGENATRLIWEKGNWLTYVTASSGNQDHCNERFAGEVWIANMESLESQRLVTDTLYIERPAWRP